MNFSFSALCFSTKFVFLPTLILREIIFGGYQKVKNCHFNQFWSFEFWFFVNFTLEEVKNTQKLEFAAAKLVKMAIFRGILSYQNWFHIKSDYSTFIKIIFSRKIWKAKKFWNFHTVDFKVWKKCISLEEHFMKIPWVVLIYSSIQPYSITFRQII